MVVPTKTLRATMLVAGLIAAWTAPITAVASAYPVPADGVAVERAIDNLAVDDRGERIRALHALSVATWEGTDETLLALLESGQISFRKTWRIARLLGMRGVENATAILTALLRDLDAEPGIRRAAAVSLGELGGRDAAVALLKALRNDPDSTVRLLAIRAFHEVQGKRAAYDLERARKHEEDTYILSYYDWVETLIDRGNTFSSPLQPGETVVCAVEGAKYLVYTPSSYRDDTEHPVLVSVHGSLGAPEPYISLARERAEAEGVVLVAPWFDAGAFLGYDNLNLGNFVIGLPRADLRLFEILDAVGKQWNVDTRRIYLFGHSRGGQFVQRFVFAHPDRIRRAAASGLGMYLTADPNFAGEHGSVFPYGPEPNPFAPDLADRGFDGLAGAPVKFFVGSEDERLVRAYYFLQEAQLRAARFGYPQQVSLEVLPGVPHSGAETFPAAADYLFGE